MIHWTNKLACLFFEKIFNPILTLMSKARGYLSGACFMF
jgi:hypothetical protein